MEEGNIVKFEVEEVAVGLPEVIEASDGIEGANKGRTDSKMREERGREGGGEACCSETRGGHGPLVGGRGQQQH